jgi:hypothetical protein
MGTKCIARRPPGTLLRDIVLFGLYLRLGQLLVLDSTVVFASSMRLSFVSWKRCVAAVTLSQPLDETAP